MKITSMILLGSMASTAVFAQQSLSFSAYGGASALYPITNKLDEQGLGLTMKRQLAPTIGVGARQTMRKGQIGIEFGLDFYQIGGKQRETFFATDFFSGQKNEFLTEIERKATYLSLPLLFTYYMKKFSMSFGGFGGIRLNNSMKITCVENGSLRAFTQYGNNLAKFDGGIKFQLGYSFSNNWELNFQYTHGFIDIGNDTEKGGKYYQFGISEITNRKLQTRQGTLGIRYYVLRLKKNCFSLL